MYCLKNYRMRQRTLVLCLLYEENHSLGEWLTLHSVCVLFYFFREYLLYYILKKCAGSSVCSSGGSEE